ncbi:MAG: hypothetical protein R2882_11510 [Gemmatimonadales bacterium]
MGLLTKAEDVGSIDAIIAALYDVISGLTGQARTDRFVAVRARGAAHPHGPGSGLLKGRLLAWSPEEYAERAGANLEKNGFFEREIGRAMERYGNIVQCSAPTTPSGPPRTKSRLPEGSTASSRSTTGRAGSW